MAAIQPIETNKIKSSDMGAKNGDGMLEVLADDMDRYGLLTVNK